MVTRAGNLLSFSRKCDGLERARRQMNVMAAAVCCCVNIYGHQPQLQTSPCPNQFDATE